MNVIAGKYKGRRLQTLEGMNTRPTSARVKEDMFNMLNNYFLWDGKTSLDLFGGSGALSIEGISRGIKTAYINDHYQPALDIIKENLKNIDTTSYVLSKKDYDVLMSELSTRGKKFDLIYLDPPFPHIEYYYNFFNKVNELKLLNTWGVILVEAPEELDLEKVKNLSLLKSKFYKSKVNKYIYIFRLEGEE